MYIKVKARAGAKKESVVKTADDSFQISVTEPAEGGRANKRIGELVRAQFPGKGIVMVKGHTTPSKIFELLE